MNRQEIEDHPILLRSAVQRAHAHACIDELPLDQDNPVEILIREQVKKRKLSLNAAMWAGPLRDIELTGWFQGRQYRAEIWHEHFKEAFLPDENDPDFDPLHVVEGYVKWAIDPWKDTRALVGSTTQLTAKGMRVYILKMEAEASQEYGVTFTERLEPMGRAS